MTLKADDLHSRLADLSSSQVSRPRRLSDVRTLEGKRPDAAKPYSNQHKIDEVRTVLMREEG